MATNVPSGQYYVNVQTAAADPSIQVGSYWSNEVVVLVGTSAGPTLPSEPDLPRQSCALEPTSHSIDGTTSTRVDFFNLTSQTVSVYWLNYNGSRVPYGTLPPGGSAAQSTYVTHPWVLIDSSGTCLGLYVAAAVPSRVVLSSSTAPPPTTNCSMPAAPSALQVLSNTGGTVTLGWSASAGAAAYVLEAGSGPSLSNLANSDVGAVTTYTATNVGTGTYYVRVRAKNACGSSLPSNEVVLVVSAPVVNPPAPPPPGAQSATQCITFVPDGTGYSWAVNSCNVQVFVEWIDQGLCARNPYTGYASCAAAPGPNGREFVTGIRGSYIYAACVYPAGPTDPGTYGGWSGGQFVCR